MAQIDPPQLTNHNVPLNDLESVAIAKLNANPRNARTHSNKQIEQIAASIERFGFNNPILVDNAYGVIAGHGRLLAAKRLKGFVAQIG